MTRTCASTSTRAWYAVVRRCGGASASRCPPCVARRAQLDVVKVRLSEAVLQVRAGLLELLAVPLKRLANARLLRECNPSRVTRQLVITCMNQVRACARACACCRAEHAVRCVAVQGARAVGLGAGARQPSILGLWAAHVAAARRLHAERPRRGQLPRRAAQHHGGGAGAQAQPRARTPGGAAAVSEGGRPCFARACRALPHARARTQVLGQTAAMAADRGAAHPKLAKLRQVRAAACFTGAHAGPSRPPALLLLRRCAGAGGPLFSRSQRGPHHARHCVYAVPAQRGGDHQHAADGGTAHQSERSAAQRAGADGSCARRHACS